MNNPVPDNFTFKVVGLSFVEGYPQNLYALQKAAATPNPQSVGEHPVFAGYRDGDAEPLPVILKRNPDNPYDSNAIEVHSPQIGMLGHVPRDVAARWAADLDAGQKFRTGVAAVLVSPGHEDNPGISIAVRRVVEAEADLEVVDVMAIPVGEMTDAQVVEANLLLEKEMLQIEDGKGAST